jgi:Acyl-CoA dehydrogenase, N-terminal domain
VNSAPVERLEMPQSPSSAAALKEWTFATEADPGQNVVDIRETLLTLNFDCAGETSGGKMGDKMRPLDRAKAISGLISEEALASERLGQFTDSVSAALLEANLFSIMVPEAGGGFGGTRVELFDTVEEIARADGSAGWCAAICNGIALSSIRVLRPKRVAKYSVMVP